MFRDSSTFARTVIVVHKLEMLIRHFLRIVNSQHTVPMQPHKSGTVELKKCERTKLEVLGAPGHVSSNVFDMI